MNQYSDSSALNVMTEKEHTTVVCETCLAKEGHKRHKLNKRNRERKTITKKNYDYPILDSSIQDSFNLKN